MAATARSTLPTTTTTTTTTTPTPTRTTRTTTGPAGLVPMPRHATRDGTRDGGPGMTRDERADATEDARARQVATGEHRPQRGDR